MSGGSRRALVAPQNTLLENVIRKISQHDSQCCFLLANARLCNWPIVYASEGFTEITGYPRSLVLTQSCICEFMHFPQTSSECIDELKESFTNNKNVQIKVQLRISKGFPLWFLLQTATIFGEKNKLFILTFKDITEERSLNKFIKEKGFAFGNKVKSRETTIVKDNKELSKEKKVGGTEEIFNLSRIIFPKYDRQAPHIPRFIVPHYHGFKFVWDSMVLFLSLYTAFIVPYNVFFQSSQNYLADGWLLSDSIVDFIFFMDLAIIFLTTIVGPVGEVISDPKIIQMNYVKSWFAVDLLSCFPYDLITYAFSQPKLDIRNEQYSNLFSSLKIVKLLRLGRIARKFDQYFEYGGAMLILLVCFFGLSGHWLACIWYTISLNYISVNEKLVSNNWLVILGEQTNQPYRLNGSDVIGGPRPTQIYSAALYYTMTSLTSVGFGNIAANTVPEKIFSIVMLLFGALLYATIFGNVTSIIQRMYEETNRYHETLKNVRNFVNLYRIPVELRDRIVDYVVSSWSMSKGIDSKQVLQYCPKDMKGDVSIQLNRTIFEKYKSFNLASESCRRAFAMEFVTTHCAPGDVICHNGEKIDSLSFVISGSLEVVQDDQVIAILCKGDVFGDDSWYMESSTSSHSSCSVKALTYCDLNSIKYEALNRVLAFYQSLVIPFIKNMKLTVNLRKRHHHRKISDKLRELEEEKRRQNEPEWTDIYPEDHPIRKFPRKCLEKVRQRKLAEEKDRGLNKGRKFSGSTFAKKDNDATTQLFDAINQQNETIEKLEKNISNLQQALSKLTAVLQVSVNSN